MGTFTPLEFSTNGGMGLSELVFLRTLANKLSSKNNEPYGSVISWLRIRLSFAILRTVHRCVKGSRYPFKSREVSEDSRCSRSISVFIILCLVTLVSFSYCDNII